MKKFKMVPVIILTGMVILQSCKKDNPNNGGGGGTTTTTTTTTTPGNGTGPNGAIVAGTDPAVAGTQGFFLDSWSAKTWTAPTTTQNVIKPTSSSAVQVSVDLSQVITKVSQDIYGNNTNPYMGQFVTEPNLMANITALSPKILRAPGGSLSDVYFWNANGTTIPAPADAPANLLDLNGNSSAAYYWYGNNPQSNSVTLDNYYKVLTQTNSKGLITVNYGYARYGTSAHPDQVAAHLAANWVRYDAGRTQFWEVGNECYGNWEAGYRIDPTKNQDGQPTIITGTIYGTHFKVFADSMRAAAAEVGNTNIKIGIVLTSSNDQTSSQGNVPNWNSQVLAAAGNAADFFVVHNYYSPYGQNSNAATILATAAPATSQMMSWVQTSVQNAGVTSKPVAMDEWNIQATGSSQNVSNIAGLHAVMTLGEVLKNQISMSSRWDLANGWANGDDQGMFNIGDEPGAAKWNARPAYYYMWFFQNYIGDRLVTSTSNSSDIVSYGSSFTSGQAGVILVNQGSTDHTVNISFKNFLPGANYYYVELNGGTDNAPFSHQVYVNATGPSGASGGPANFNTIAPIATATSGGIYVIVPAYGAVFLVADK